MATTLYIPAYTADIARQKARVFEGREPFYWREAKAAHEAADWHYPDGKVFAVTRRADGTIQVREHIQIGSEHEIDPRPLTVGDVINLTAFGMTFCAGLWLIGKATLL